MNRTQLTNSLVVTAVVAIVAAVAYMRHERSASPVPAVPPAAGLPRMLDLGADKCLPCLEMAPILVELRGQYAGRATIEFIDIWENPQAGTLHGVRVIPTQIFFDRDGREVWRHEGFLSREEIVAKLRELGAG